MKLVMFLDTLQRLILAKYESETDTDLFVECPVCISSQVRQDGTLNIQTIPVVFRELLSGENVAKFRYKKQNIVLTDATSSKKLTDQYTSIYEMQTQKVEKLEFPSAENKVPEVKLFD